MSCVVYVLFIYNPLCLLTALADKETLAPTVFTVSAWFWFRHRRYHFFAVCFAAVACAWLIQVFTSSVHRDIKVTGSFPSGHAVFATVVYAYAAWFIGFLQAKMA